MTFPYICFNGQTSRNSEYEVLRFRKNTFMPLRLQVFVILNFNGWMMFVVSTGLFGGFIVPPVQKDLRSSQRNQTKCFSALRLNCWMIRSRSELTACLNCPPAMATWWDLFHWILIKILLILEFLSDAGRLSRLCNNTRPVSSVAAHWKLTGRLRKNKIIQNHA
jgi:hypothetical protein